MNNSIETICLSLVEKGQKIKNNVAYSIDKLHQQENIHQEIAPIHKQSNPKVKFLLFGGLLCLSAGVLLGLSTQPQSARQELKDNKIELKNDRSQKKTGHGPEEATSIILDILGVAGICSGTFLSLRRKRNSSYISPIIEKDYTKCSSDIIEAICSIKESCSKEWDETVMEHTKYCKQFIDTMACSEDEKVEKKESVTASSLIKYNSFEIQQLIDSASSTHNISVINDAVDTCSKKLQDAIDSAITQQVSIYKNVLK